MGFFLDRGTRRLRQMGYLMALSSSGQEQEYAAYRGVSCASDSYPESRCFRLLNASLPDCWDLCSVSYEATNVSLGAAYSRREPGVCCCAVECPCFIEDELFSTSSSSSFAQPFSETRLALRLPQEPQFCTSESARSLFDQFFGWDCDELGPIMVFENAFSKNLASSPAERNEMCWDMCRDLDVVAAVSINETCKCYSSCKCKTSREDAVCAFDVTKKPPYDCFNIFDRVLPDFLSFAQVDCVFPSKTQGPRFPLPPEARSLAPPNVTIKTPRDWCWEACYAAMDDDLLASRIDFNTSVCSCHDACSCLEATPGDATVQLSILNDILKADIDDCDADLEFIGDDLYDSLYASYDDVACDTTESRVCFYVGLDKNRQQQQKDPKLQRYDCYAYCANWVAPFFDGILDAAYVDAENSECCCLTNCDCLRPGQPNTFLLALANDGPSSFVNTTNSSLLRQRNNAPTIDTCSDSSSSKKNNKQQIAPGLYTSDLWWIILICVVSLFAIAFFVRVEEGDKHRRQKLTTLEEERNGDFKSNDADNVEMTQRKL